MAYEHGITIDAAEGKVKPLFQQLVAACEADRDNHCTVLNSSLEAGRYDSANVRLRAKAPGINKLLALTAAGGELARQAGKSVVVPHPKKHLAVGTMRAILRQANLKGRG